MIYLQNLYVCLIAKFSCRRKYFFSCVEDGERVIIKAAPLKNNCKGALFWMQKITSDPCLPCLERHFRIRAQLALCNELVKFVWSQWQQLVTLTTIGYIDNDWLHWQRLVTLTTIGCTDDWLHWQQLVTVTMIGYSDNDWLQWQWLVTVTTIGYTNNDWLQWQWLVTVTMIEVE